MDAPVQPNVATGASNYSCRTLPLSCGCCPRFVSAVLSPHEFGTRLIDTKDLQHGWTADLGVSHVGPKKGLLEALPFGVGVVSGEWWESTSACPIIPSTMTWSIC